jgi:hypothetical protein
MAKKSTVTLPASNRALLLCLVAWSLVWKGSSLWRAAKQGSKPWFVVLFVSNTLGILDAIYLFGAGRWRQRTDREDPRSVRRTPDGQEQTALPTKL